MSPTHREYFARLDQLFQETVEIPAGEERDAFLRASTGGHPDLLRDITRLLDRDRIVQQAPSSVPHTLPRFGPYQAREVLGSGGMGTVYRATREDGELVLEVAVKSISSTLFSSVLEERFRRERQILAQLRHPGIASFLDGGIGEDGLPFLVMELVAGESIDVYCDRHKLSVRQRLQLFLAVCNAVDFAHHQLIVHRDIKPGNILVNATGEPKLLDFGLARSLEVAAVRPDNPTLFFTPLYASPEVLHGRPAAVTDDVYSLGILLYRLLIGSRPFTAAGTTPAEIVDSVLHSEPRKASAVLRSMKPAEVATIAEARAETRAGLLRALEGDLDAIALRSVAPSAAERYPTAAELAEDIAAFLDGRAVRAAAGGVVYRTRKFILRHKLPVAAAILIVVSLAAGLAATLVEAREARAQRAAAERRFQDSRSLARYMMFELQNSIQKLPGSTPVKADMVRHSLDYLDRVAGERSNDDSLRIDLAQGYSELADVLGHPLRPNLGQPAQARATYLKAIHLLEPVVAQHPQNIAARRALAHARLMLGMSLVFYRQWGQGSKLVEMAESDLAQMADASPGDFDTVREAATAADSLAVALSQRDGYASGGHDDAMSDFKKSIAYADEALRLKPRDEQTSYQLASAYNRLALLTQTRDRATAAAYFQHALATLDSLPSDEQESAEVRNQRALVLVASGWNLGSMGRYDAGLASIHASAAIIEQLLQEDPQNRVYPQARASIYRNLGVIEDYAGHTEAALAAYKTAASQYQQLLAANPNSPYYHTSLADLSANAALLSARLGRRQEAQQLARASVPVLRQTALQSDASAAELNLAARFLTESEFPEFCDARLGLQLAQRANAAASGKDYVVLQTLAQAYWINRDRAHAIDSIQQALTLIGSPRSGDPPSRSQREYQQTLEEYRSKPLAAGCGSAKPRQ